LRPRRLETAGDGGHVPDPSVVGGTAEEGERTLDGVRRVLPGPARRPDTARTEAVGATRLGVSREDERVLWLAVLEVDLEHDQVPVPGRECRQRDFDPFLRREPLHRDVDPTEHRNAVHALDGRAKRPGGGNALRKPMEDALPE